MNQIMTSLPMTSHHTQNKSRSPWYCVQRDQVNINSLTSPLSDLYYQLAEHFVFLVPPWAQQGWPHHRAFVCVILSDWIGLLKTTWHGISLPSDLYLGYLLSKILPTLYYRTSTLYLLFPCSAIIFSLDCKTILKTIYFIYLV